jgi:hypothetical protein
LRPLLAVDMADKELEPGEIFPGQNKVREILKGIDMHRSLMLDKYGGDMWEELKKWLEKDTWAIEVDDVLEKMKEIEKEYI